MMNNSVSDHYFTYRKNYSHNDHDKEPKGHSSHVPLCDGVHTGVEELKEHFTSVIDHRYSLVDF